MDCLQLLNKCIISSNYIMVYIQYIPKNGTKSYYVRYTNKQHIINHTYHIHNHELDLRGVIDNKLMYLVCSH